MWFYSPFECELLCSITAATAADAATHRTSLATAAAQWFFLQWWLWSAAWRFTYESKRTRKWELWLALCEGDMFAAATTLTDWTGARPRCRSATRRVAARTTTLTIARSTTVSASATSSFTASTIATSATTGLWRRWPSIASHLHAQLPAV